MRYAVIDLGTNTFNLLIGEHDGASVQYLYSTKRPVLLGMSGITTAQISDSALQRARTCLLEFKEVCEQWQVLAVKAFGTSALRGAKNSQEFQAVLSDVFGVKAEIISGEREAELIYKGVDFCHNFQTESLIMDIGGGSTEFIHVVDGKVSVTHSLNIGVTRIYERLGFPTEFTPDHFDLIRQDLNDHSSFLQELSCTALIGCSGSFETFAEMILQERVAGINNSIKLDLGEVREVLSWTLQSTNEEREANEWIIPLRKKMLPISAVKIRWILDLLEPEEVWLSPFSLKEGAFSEIAEGNG